MRPPFLPKDDDYSGLFAFLAALAAVAIGFLFLAHAAFAQTTVQLKQDQCKSAEEFVDGLNRFPPELRNTMHVRILDGDDAQRWIAAFNAIPPVSDIQLTRIVLVVHDEPSPVIFAGEQDGCIVGIARIPLAVHERILRDSNNVRGAVL